MLAERYQIEAAIGEGGSGQVFRAWDRVLGEAVALKILRREKAEDRSWSRRLAREVKVARAIRHRNVCRVFDLGFADGHWFMSMELAPGGALREMLRAGAPRPLAARLADARAICEGLASIHDVGIIHRDVTPHNILRMADGRLVLSDFGLAVENADTTLYGGTPSYMPPESAMGVRPDQRADVWQLGFVMHEVLFGRRPEWRQEPTEMVLCPPPVGPAASRLERALARICADCLAQHPGDRPASALAVASRLADVEQAGPRAALDRVRAGAQGWLRRHGAGAMSISVLATAAVAGVAAAWRASRMTSANDHLPDEIWTAQQREAARRAFAATGDPEASAAFEEIDRLFAKHLGR